MSHQPHNSFNVIVQKMRKVYDLRIRKWRTTMSGCAWRVYHADGRIVNWIESPYPKTPISLAIFLHEVGHHVIGFTKYKVRCEEEYHAWLWALDTMEQMGIVPDERVLRRFELSMEYAVAKALRRRIKKLPSILVEFIPEDLTPKAA